MLLTILVTYLAGCFLGLSYHLRLSKTFKDVTCVHQMYEGRAFAPAYMVLENGVPTFYHLYTNLTFGSYTDYTGFSDRLHAYRQIRLTSPVYWRKTLLEALQEPIVNTTNYTSPVVQRIMDRKKQFWWSRCVRHYEELKERLNQSGPGRQIIMW